MKRVALQILLGIGALLMFFRFGGPALFFGAMMIGIGFVLVLVIFRIQALASAVYMLACAIALGAVARIYARIAFGNPGTAGTIPIVLETTLPVLIVLLQYYVVKESKESLK